MGNKLSIQKVNFEDIQNVLNNQVKNVLIINTLENTSEAQYCILPGTVSYANEEKIINNYLNDNKKIRIIIYGKNVNDISIYKKYTQLVELGFENVYVYSRGNV